MTEQKTVSNNTDVNLAVDAFVVRGGNVIHLGDSLAALHCSQHISGGDTDYSIERRKGGFTGNSL